MSIVIYAFQESLDYVPQLGFPVITTLRSDTSTLVKHAGDVIVRWGKSHLPEDGAAEKREFLHVLNPAASIKANVNKGEALTRMSRVVLTPQIWRDRIPKGKLGVLRPFQHCAGDGFRTQQGPFQVPPGHYATEFIKTETETRVWAVRSQGTEGYTMYARRAQMRDDKQVYVRPCRSLWGYIVDDFKKPVPAELHQLVLTAMNEMDLDVIAADCLLIDDVWVILEQNTRPNADLKAIRRFYAESIYKAAKVRYPRLDVGAPPVPNQGEGVDVAIDGVVGGRRVDVAPPVIQAAPPVQAPVKAAVVVPPPVPIYPGLRHFQRAAVPPAPPVLPVAPKAAAVAVAPVKRPALQPVRRAWAWWNAL